jgi:hypothetical protein
VQRGTEALPAADGKHVEHVGRECVVCFVGERDVEGWVMLRPCGHVCVCKKCAECLVSCPLCRQQVSESFPCFL